MKLQIWDVAGQKRFRAITNPYYRGADGIILVYDVTNPGSVVALGEFWIREVRNHAKKKPTVQLVGNKADLKASQTPETTAQVEEQLRVLLKTLADDGVVASTEVSAKDGCEVASAFEGLVDPMLDARALREGVDPNLESTNQSGVAYRCNIQ